MTTRACLANILQPVLDATYYDHYATIAPPPPSPTPAENSKNSQNAPSLASQSFTHCLIDLWGRMLGCESDLTQNQPHWHRLAQVEAIAKCDANKRRCLCWLLHRLYCWSIRHLCGHLRHDRKSRILAAGHARPPVLTFPVREADHTDLLHRALPFVAILYCAFFQTDPKTECKDCLFIIRV